MHYLSVIVLAHVLLTTSLLGDNILALGSKSISPDGKYSTELVKRDKDVVFRVKNLSNGEITTFIADYNPFHALRWSADSSTILIVQQVSEGTFAGMIHNDGRTWIKTDFMPIDTDDKFTLLSWKINEQAVKLTYTVTLEEGRDEAQNRKYGHYIYSFDVNFQAAKKSNVHKESISLQQMHAFKSDF